MSVLNSKLGRFYS